jgi:AcrR family transcriptional regulator
METEDKRIIPHGAATRGELDVRERLLHRANLRFRSEGFTAVTVDELADDLGVSKKTFYKYFSTKEELLEAIVEQTLTGMWASFLAIMDRDAPFVERLDELMSLFGNLFRTLNPRLVRDIQRHAPAVWQRIETFRRERILTNFTAFLLEGKERGAIRPDVNIKIFILAYLASIERILTPETLANESFSGEEAAQTILRIFFSGILTPEDAKNFGNQKPLS